MENKQEHLTKQAYLVTFETTVRIVADSEDTALALGHARALQVLEEDALMDHLATLALDSTRPYDVAEALETMFIRERLENAGEDVDVYRSRRDGDLAAIFADDFSIRVDLSDEEKREFEFYIRMVNEIENVSYVPSGVLRKHYLYIKNRY